MARGLILIVSLAGALLASWFPPGLAEPVAIAVVQDRVYRSGVFLVVDVLIKNTTARTVEGIEALVEFYDFFGELVRVEPSVAIPARLGPGQIAALRVVTPYSDAARKVYYRFTWRQDGEQLQATLKRDIWMIGSPTR